jgi:hypothetical protein
MTKTETLPSVEYTGSQFVYLTKIRGNLRGAFEFNALQPAVFVQGDNGTGKTAFLNAVELVCTGQAYDVLTEDPAKSAQLLIELLPPGAEELYIEAQFSDGSEASWRLRPGGRVVWTPPAHPVLYLYPVIYEGLYGSYEKQLRFLFRYLTPASAIRSNLQHDNPAVNELINNWAETAEHARTVADFWLTVEANASALMYEARTRKNVLKKALEQLETIRPSGPRNGGRDLLHMAATLCRAQVTRSAAKCLVCGDDHTLEHYLERAPKLEAKLHDLGGPPVTASQGVQEVLTQAMDEAAAAEQVAALTIKHCHTIMWQGVKSAAPLIERDLNAVVQRGDRHITIGLEVDAAGKIRIGKRHGTHIFRVASGAERAVLIANVAAAVAARIQGTALLVFPDKGYDTQSVAATVRRLSGVPANVFFQTVGTRPVGRPAAFWSYVQTSRGGA